METFDEVRNFWQNNKEENNPVLIKNELEEVIKLKLNKEKKQAAQYFWLSFIFQNAIYAFACFMIIKYWGNNTIMLLSAIGALVYIPLTIVLMQKFKAFFKAKPYNTSNIQDNVKRQYASLSGFFNFKKRFDYLFIPVNALILTGILFQLYAPVTIKTNLMPALIVFAGFLIIYAIAAWFENKKHFVVPLKRFRFILEDLEDGRQ